MNGCVFYNGPSLIDGGPIVGILTGLLTPSTNQKTGPMAQVYILRSDMAPVKAVQTGDDQSICGSCQHRGDVVTNDQGLRKNVNRSCYVTLIHGPGVIYRGYEAGSYKQVPVEIAAKALQGRDVRIGAYGDPGAIPVDIWTSLIRKARSVNSYTHLWREFPVLNTFCMASVDNEQERLDAKALGFRTFRVRRHDDPVMTGEGICPASIELGKAVQCTSCMLCGGNRNTAKADIVIMAHGTGKKNFEVRNVVAPV